MERPPHPLTIVIGLQDAGIAFAAAATVRSLLDTQGSDPLHLFVLYEELDSLTKQRLRSSWPEKHLQVHWICAAERLEPFLALSSRGTLLRLMIGDLLPDWVRRALWLDVDMLVLTDLTPLWCTPLQGKVVGAIPDPYAVTGFGAHYHLLESAAEAAIPYAREHRYFNAGLLLVDLERWRARKLDQRTQGLLHQHPGRFVLLDQDVLNLSCQDDVHYLDTTWNVFESMANLWEWDPDIFRGLHPEEGLLQPSIRHFAGHNKAWGNWVRQSEAARFFEVLDRTDWRGWRPQERHPILTRWLRGWFDFQWLTVRAFWWPRNPKLVQAWFRELARNPLLGPLLVLYFLRLGGIFLIRKFSAFSKRLARHTSKH